VVAFCSPSVTEMTSAPGLLDYLHQLQVKGHTHIHLDQGAKMVLRELYKKARAAQMPQQQAVGAQNPVETVTPAPSANFTNPAARLEPQLKKTAPLPVGKLTPTNGSVSERIEALKGQTAQWPAFTKLGTLRSTMVFSMGDPEADIMLVGEAPGFQDERAQSPFAGHAGDKLVGILKAMGLQRENVYITNVVKYRPAMADQSTGNRKPSEAEVAASLPFLNEEISIVQPKIIIALGATAARALTGGQGSLVSQRGAWHSYEGTPVRVSYHPSYLLHSEKSLSDKRQVWEDMLAVMEKMEMPISEKQRGYFKSKA